MQARKSKKLKALKVTLASAVSTLPAPSGAPSAGLLTAFARWQDGQLFPDAASIIIDADAAITLQDATLYGWDNDDLKWRSIGVLNASIDIPLTATTGFEQRVRDVGIFEALAVSATIVGAGNVDVFAVPFESFG